MDLNLKGRVALVIASSDGLGKACAMQLAIEGAEVAICGRTPSKLKRAQQELSERTSSQIAAFAADITDRVSIQRLVDATLARFGRIDILVTNAGTLPRGRFLELREEDWEHGINMTLKSVIRLSRCVLPQMEERRWGRIINLASTSVQQVLEGVSMSSVVRLGVLALTKILSNEYAHQGICVHSVCAGPFMTEGQRKMLAELADQGGVGFESAEQNWISDIPMRRHGQPEELAALVAFLASDRASYMTGNVIQVDGGRIQRIT